MKKEIDKKKDRISTELKALSGNVNSELVAKAIIEYGVSEPTIRRYLRGEVASIPTGETLLKFFKKQSIATA